ncbi:general secretion pathway protein GspK [Yersinia similis]|uniref:general secretion pathway protein GspK n=1 Tax=Yersinia similis TaxID=367190 RepID=UPI00061CB0DF|nr:general secretion pathway protein GspK [Yersinia similis]CNB48310.1 general secretion pathway protein K [Yersinia similis]
MNQHGIALLIVLCTLFLMSTMVMVSYHYWFDIYYLVKNSQQRQKEKWILLGAEEKFVSELIKKISYDSFHYNEFRHSVSEGQITTGKWSVNIKSIDNTNCFNINALRTKVSNPEKIIKTYPWRVFKYLLLISGVEIKETQDTLARLIDLYRSSLIFEQRNNGLSMLKNIPYEVDEINISSNMSRDDFLKIAPMLCIRRDRELLVNINMLEVENSQYLQTVLLNTVTERDIYDVISAKPNKGWGSTFLFYSLLTSYSTMSDRDVNKNILDKLTVDEYFINYIFRIDSKDSYYQLISFIHVVGKTITVLQRRYSFSEQHN